VKTGIGALMINYGRSNSTRLTAKKIASNHSKMKTI